MGFRAGAYATVWEVKPFSNTFTKVRLSVSRKDRQTNEYVTEFSGFVAFVGTANAAKAANLHERDRIKLGDTDVRTKYVKESNTTYTDFVCFSFESQNEGGNAYPPPASQAAGGRVDGFSFIEDGLDGDGDDEELPF